MLTPAARRNTTKPSQRRVERTKNFLVEHGVPADDFETQSGGPLGQMTASQSGPQGRRVPPGSSWCVPRVAARALLYSSEPPGSAWPPRIKWALGLYLR